MTPEELIGTNVAKARRQKSWTQEQLGEAVGEVLGRRWSRQAVSEAESGKRDFRARDLIALALVLEQPVSWFLTPLGDDQRVRLGRRQVDPLQLIAVFSPHPIESLDAIGRQTDMLRGLLEDLPQVPLEHAGSVAAQALPIVESIERTAGVYRAVQRRLRQAHEQVKSEEPARARSRRRKK